MTDLEKRTLEMLRNVRNFGSTHDVAFQTGTLARDFFDNVGNIVNDLEGFAAQQRSGNAAAREQTSVKATERSALLDAMTIISRTARAMAITSPGLEDKFRLPNRNNDQLLLDTARAFLADAQPLKAEFLRYEVPERVFQDLEANIAAFQARRVGQYESGESSGTAGTAFDASMELALNYVRQLDAIVRNKFHNNPAGLAAWERARHVERPSRRSKHDHPPAPPADGNNPPPASDN